MGGEGTVRVVMQVCPPPTPSAPSARQSWTLFILISQKAHCLLCLYPPQASLPQAIMSVSSFAKQQMQLKCEECR